MPDRSLLLSGVVLLLAAACSSSPVPTAPAFSLTVSPASLTLPPLATGTARVSIERPDGLTGPIAIALAGLPDGVSVDAPAIAAGASSAVLTFHNQRTGNSLAGVVVAVTGSAGGQSAAAHFALTVQCPATAGPSLSVLAGAAGGAGNADDVGQDARFLAPVSLVGDGAGSLYVADTFNSVVRKVAPSTGVVTTIAGSPGTFDSSDGTGSAARFGHPFGIARDGDQLFVADTFNHIIRRIDLRSGAVTTVAGTAGQQGAADGPGASALFNFPTGIAAAGGSVFVADTSNHTIRRIDLATLSVTTLAGSPGVVGSTDGICDLARFNTPGAIAADGSGSLFVADTNNQTIRKIDIASESVTTVAGAPGETGSSDGPAAAARFKFPSGVASDGAGNLYVADTFNHLIRRIALRSGAVTTVAGVVSLFCRLDDLTRLCFPRNVTVEAGAIYVADTGAHRIGVLSGTALVTVAGRAQQPGNLDGSGTSARFSGLSFIAGDGADTVYVPQMANGTIRKVSISSGQVTTLAGPAAFFSAEGITVDGDSLYVTDAGFATVSKVALATGEVTIIAGTPHAFGVDDGIGAAARFEEPTGIASDGNGHLYLSDFGRIRKIDLDTRSVTTLSLTSPEGVAFVSSPSGLALDGAGNLYVADTPRHAIRRIDLSSQVITTIAGALSVDGFADGTGGDARFSSPRGIAFDGAGTLYVADTSNAVVRTIELATGVVSTVVGQPRVAGVKAGPLPARLNLPTGIALFGPGRLVVADGAENVLLATSP